MPDPRPPAGVSRRLVSALLGVGIFSTITGFAGAAFAYLWPSARVGGTDVLVGATGPVDPAGIGHDESVVGRSRLGKVLVIRKREELIGLQATCTHLGCTVAWNADSQQIECPCHGARYNLRGDVLRGPARDPLGRVDVTIEQGAIRVRPPLEG